MNQQAVELPTIHLVEGPIAPSYTRLMDYAQRITARSSRRVERDTDLAARLGQSDGTVNNWKRRGVSKGGALAAEAEFGCSASWVLSGEGAADAPAGLLAQEAGSRYTVRTARDTLRDLRGLLDSLSPTMLNAFTDVLAAWARTAGRDEQRLDAMLHLLAAETKPRRAGQV